MGFLKDDNLSPHPQPAPFLVSTCSLHHSLSIPVSDLALRSAPGRGSGHLDSRSNAVEAPTIEPGGEAQGSQGWVLHKKENSTESPRNST